jgi:hypothetical protein
MQLAMNASPAPRRIGSVACCAFSKQKACICHDAPNAGGAIVTAKVTAASAHFRFMTGFFIRKSDISAS